MKRLFSLFVLALLVFPTAGCLAKTLRTPAEDHYVQTRAVAERCAVAGCPDDLQADLDAMALQAQCIDAIVKGQKCEQLKSEGDQ